MLTFFLNLNFLGKDPRDYISYDSYCSSQPPVTQRPNAARITAFLASIPLVKILENACKPLSCMIYLENNTKFQDKVCKYWSVFIPLLQFSNLFKNIKPFSDWIFRDARITNYRFKIQESAVLSFLYSSRIIWPISD